MAYREKYYMKLSHIKIGLFCFEHLTVTLMYLNSQA